MALEVKPVDSSEAPEVASGAVAKAVRPEWAALERRAGAPPIVTGPAPHGQRSQTPPVMLQEGLWGLMRALPFVYMAPTLVSVSHSRALFLP